MFSHSVRVFLAVLFSIFCLSAAFISAAAEEQETETVRYFLTSQEKLYEGVPEDRGDSWLVKLPDQSGGLLISKLDILFIGSSREAVFEFQKSRLPDGNFTAAAKLAEWGTRNQLSDSALELLREKVLEADPETRIVLQRQIDRIEYVERLKMDARSRLKNSASQNSPDKAKNPEMQRLEDFARQVPVSVQESYVRKVQPLLLRRCALADCHQAGTSGMALTFVKPERQSLRRGNLLNLEQVLRRVNPTLPGESQILHHPEIIDQYGQQVYPFGDDANTLKDYKMFTDWVISLEKKIKPIFPDNGINESVLQVSTPGVPNPEAEKSSIYAARPIDLTDSVQKDTPCSGSKYRKLPPNSSIASVSNLDEIKIHDEFDPEPFNKKFHPDHVSENENGNEPAE